MPEKNLSKSSLRYRHRQGFGGKDPIAQPREWTKGMAWNSRTTAQPVKQPPERGSRLQNGENVCQPYVNRELISRIERKL